jgi:hypothetical protein
MNPEQTTIPLNLQNASIAMQKFNRQAELQNVSPRTDEQSDLDHWLQEFVTQHGPTLVASYLIIAPLQRSLGAIIGPIISSVIQPQP